MIYLACVNLDECGRLTRVESSTDETLSTCPHCFSVAVVFLDKITALKAINKTDNDKEIDLAIVAEILKHKK